MSCRVGVRLGNYGYIFIAGGGFDGEGYLVEGP